MSSEDPLPSLDALKHKINKASIDKEYPEESTSGAAASGLRVGLDLVSGVVVGIAAGYGLDSWFETSPVFMLVCFMLGTAAGVRLMIQTSNRISADMEKHDAREKERAHLSKGEEIGRR